MGWFGLPKRTEYILRSLSCMARSTGPLPVRTIAACEGIPASFLAQILYQLTWHGLVSSKRGPGGGFALAQAPDQIRLKQVLEIFQVPPDHPPKENSGSDFSQVWEKLWEPTRYALETLTLADLLQVEAPATGATRATDPGARSHPPLPGKSAKRRTG